MQPREFIRAQALLNLTNIDMAATLGMCTGSVCSWRNGHIPVPPYVALALRLLLELPTDKREAHITRYERGRKPS